MRLKNVNLGKITIPQNIDFTPEIKLEQENINIYISSIKKFWDQVHEIVADDINN